MIKHENGGQYEGVIIRVAAEEEKDRKHLEKAPEREWLIQVLRLVSRPAGQCESSLWFKIFSTYVWSYFKLIDE